MGTAGQDVDDPNAKPLRTGLKAYTRQRLSEAARTVFARIGYQDATVEKIAAEAGASRGTFYLHFKSKTEVLVELWKEQLDSDLLGLYHALDQLGPNATREDVRDWLELAVDYWTRSREMSELSEQALALEPEVAEDWWGRIQTAIDAMPETIARWEAEGRTDCRLRLTLLMVQFERLCYFWLVRDVELERAEVLDVLTDFWASTLYGLPARSPGAAEPEASD